MGLASEWEDFDDVTKVALAIAELDRIWRRLDSIGDQRLEARHLLDTQLAILQTDLNQRLEKIDQKTSKFNALMYTIIGGVMVGLVLTVVQLIR